MKFIIIVFILCALFINADIVNFDNGDFLYNYQRDFIFIKSEKNIFSYDFAFSYFNTFDLYSISIGLKGYIYDNIELTSIPTPDSAISINNIPYVYDNKTVYKFKLPASIIINRDNINIGILLNTYFNNLYNNKFISNSIDISLFYEKYEYSIELILENIAGNLFYNNNDIKYYYEPIVKLEWLYNIKNDNELELYSGLNINVSNVYQTYYNFKYGDIGFNRALIVGVNYKTLKMRLYLFSPQFDIFAHYKLNKDFFINIAYSNIMNYSKFNIGIGKHL